MSDSFYYEDSKCPKCPRKDRARLADPTLGVSHVKDVARFWKRGTRSWGPPPSGSLSLGLFQSFSETWNCNANDSFPCETDDDIIVEYSAVGSRDWRSEADVEHVSCFIIVHVELCKLGNCQVGLDLPSIHQRHITIERCSGPEVGFTVFRYSTSLLLHSSNRSLGILPNGPWRLSRKLLDCTSLLIERPLFPISSRLHFADSTSDMRSQFRSAPASMNMSRTSRDSILDELPSTTRSQSMENLGGT